MQQLGRRASFLLPLSFLGCSKTRSPEAAAAEFVDRYYVEKDHAKALDVSADLAARRVQEEQHLLKEAGVGGPGAQPRVYYKLVRETDRKDDTELIYTMTIDAGGMKLQKELRLLVKAFGKDFKVVSFAENDVAAP